jgi:hypothetical protein
MAGSPRRVCAKRAQWQHASRILCWNLLRSRFARAAGSGNGKLTNPEEAAAPGEYASSARAMPTVHSDRGQLHSSFARAAPIESGFASREKIAIRSSPR